MQIKRPDRTKLSFVTDLIGEIAILVELNFRLINQDVIIETSSFNINVTIIYIHINLVCTFIYVNILIISYSTVLQSI